MLSRLARTGISALGGSLSIVGPFVDLLVNTDLTVPHLAIATGAIDGTGNLTVTGALDWTGGSMQGTGTTTIPSGAALNITGDAGKLLNRTLNNAGTTTWAGAGGVYFGDTAVFNNQAGGTFDLTSDAQFGGNFRGTVNNAGTFDADPGGGNTTTVAAAVFNNTGTVNINSSSFQVINNGTDSGAVNAAAGASLVFTSSLVTNLYTITPAATFTGGAGASLAFVGPFTSVELDASWTVPDFTLSSGQLSGTGNLTVTGSANWTGGTITGTGAFNIPAGAKLSISTTTNFKSLTGGRTLNNAGTVTWTDGTIDSGAPFVINNTGTFLIQGDVNLQHNADSIFNNSGTLTKSGGTGISNFRRLTLNNTGTVIVNSGTLNVDTVAQVTGTKLTGGTWEVGAGATLNFTSGVGLAENDASVILSGAGASFPSLNSLATNAGGLTLGPGAVLSLPGPFAPTAAGTLTIEIGGSSASGQFGQLHDAGAATLDGTLALGLAGGFIPGAGDRYLVMTYTSAIGTFAAIRHLSSGAGQTLGVQVNPMNVTVTAGQGATDLAVASVNVPTSGGVPGQPAAINYTVNNLSAATPGLSDWTDSVYASLSDTFGPSAVLIQRVPHHGGVAGLGSYTGTVTAPLPGLAPGSYHIFVVADSRGLLADPNRANNVGTGSTLLAVTNPTLSLGPPLTDTIDNGQDKYYEVNLPAGSAMQVTATFAGAPGGEVYVGYQSVPSPTTFVASSADPTQSTQQVLLPGTQAGAYFILVHGREASMGGKPFTLTIQALPLQVLGVGPDHGGNVGPVTLTVHGTQFTAGTTISLVPAGGGAPVASSGVTFQDAQTLYATFNLTGATPGRYNVQVSEGGMTATDAGAFTVDAGGVPGHLEVSLSTPRTIRRLRQGVVTVDYTNTGDTDIPAPLLELTADNATLELPGQSGFQGSVLPRAYAPK